MKLLKAVSEVSWLLGHGLKRMMSTARGVPGYIPPMNRSIKRGQMKKKKYQCTEVTLFAQFLLILAGR